MKHCKDSQKQRHLDSLIGVYLRAKGDILSAGYADEIDWQEDLSFDGVSEADFLMEGAWVILSSGMREKIVRRKFKVLSEIF